MILIYAISLLCRGNKLQTITLALIKLSCTGDMFSIVFWSILIGSIGLSMSVELREDVQCYGSIAQ